MIQEMQVSQMPVSVNGKDHAVPSTEIKNGKVSLRAVQPEDISLIWAWLNEYPSANFDDYGPQSVGMLHDQILTRIQAGEYIAVATLNEKPVGVIGYRVLTGRMGEMRGICFAKEVHDTGVCHFAVKNFLKVVMASGKLQKIKACFFKDSKHIKKFLSAMGFVHEGTLMSETMRGGKAIDVSVVALYRKNWETT